MVTSSNRRSGTACRSLSLVGVVIVMTLVAGMLAVTAAAAPSDDAADAQKNAALVKL